MFTRLVRLWKADLHGVMDQLEDRELLLNQHLREMETALDAREAAVRRLERDRESVVEARNRRETEIASLETDIEAALDQERDDIARFLIRRRREL
ncbi:MAG: PspA/IM30 family protein, partial [Desulfococcaceae bacterium]